MLFTTIHHRNCITAAAQVGGEARLAGREAVVRPFRTDHRVASQGYTLFSVKRKLKAHLVGLPGTEIKALRAGGEVSICSRFRDL